MITFVTIQDGISFLVNFCYEAYTRVIGLGGLFDGVAFIIGFILIWKIIDNFVPKG